MCGIQLLPQVSKRINTYYITEWNVWNYFQCPSLLSASFIKTELHPSHFWQEEPMLVRHLAASSIACPGWFKQKWLRDAWKLTEALGRTGSSWRPSTQELGLQWALLPPLLLDLASAAHTSDTGPWIPGALLTYTRKPRPLLPPGQERLRCKKDWEGDLVTSVSGRQPLQCRKPPKDGMRVQKILGGHKHKDQRPLIQHQWEQSNQRGSLVSRFSLCLLVYCVCLVVTVLSAVVLAF